MAEYNCVLQCGERCNSAETISADIWAQLQTKTKEWKGLDRFGSVFESTQWERGAKDFFVHKSCYISISSKRKLGQAMKRKEKGYDEKEMNSSCAQQDDTVEVEKEAQPSSPKRLRSSIGGPLHEKDKCVWCMKGADTKHPDRKTGTKLLRISTLSGWREFKRHTVNIKDELLRVRLSKLVESISALSDVFATDVYYHHSCWLQHIHMQIDPSDAIHLQNVTYCEMKQIFFKRIDKIIFQEHEFRSLQSLLDEYRTVAMEYGFDVGRLKSSYVKEILSKEYGDRIGFHERGKNISEFVYDTHGGGSYVNAAFNSFGITDEQLILNLAPRLCKHINETSELNWCPSVDELLEDENVSHFLLKLLSAMKRKHGHKELSEEDNPVIRVLSSLITYFVTGKRTITCVNLTVVIHGMTRSKELIDILHKCGICISYNSLLLLYAIWAWRDVESSKTCPREITYGKPPVVIVDNDDFKIDTLTGNASGAHRTNVLYVQPEEYEEKRDTDPPMIVKDITKKEVSEELDVKCKELTAVQQYVLPPGADREPPIRERVHRVKEGQRTQRLRSVIHAVARSSSSGERPSVETQIVPSYAGFQSCLLPAMRKSKAYYHVTYNEPPKKSVLNDVMIKLLNTMKEKGMPFSFLVGDLPTYKLILELKTENKEKFQDIIPIIGAFHQQMSYIYAIYKRFLGSGLSDLLVSAGVIVEGSVDQALRGKHYRRGLRCIMLWREALIHKRLSILIENESLSSNTVKNLDILRKVLTENHDNISSAYSDLEMDEDIQKLVEGVYEKINTDMGDYWLSFLGMSDILLQNVDACHVGNLDEYLSSTLDMVPGELAYNNHDYGKMLPDFWAMICSLPYERKKYFSEHFSQSMTGLPFSGQPMDLWIEVTMNLDSKLKQGWLQLLHNDTQLFCTTRNASNVSRVKSALKQTLNCSCRHHKHVECQPARMKKDEQAIQDLLLCLDDFDADPFDDSAPNLRSLQSGVSASSEVVEDLANALDEGEAMCNEILEKRVYSKELGLKASIPRNKRLSLATNPVHIAARSTSSNAVEMERRALAMVIDCAEKNDLIALETVLENRISDECLTMFNADGSMRKTAKSKLRQSFSTEPLLNKPSTYISLVDMGLIWRLASPTSDDRDIKKRSGVEYLWVDYLNKVCSMVYSRHSNATKIILVNDNYEVSSIKDDEHERRAANHINLPNVYPKENDKFPSPSQFKRIMLKSENKVRLQKLLRRRFEANVNDQQAEVIYCVGEVAVNLNSGLHENAFSFQHVEADTMLLTAYAKLRDFYDGTVVIDSEDTDVYVQAAYVSNNSPGCLLIKNKNTLINCADLVPNNIANVVIPFHVISGSDHTAGFYGRGKKSLFEKLQKDSEAQRLLQNVGVSLDLTEEVKADMRKFVLTKIYGIKAATCREARAAKWRKMKKKSLSRLPPDEDTLHHHLDRTNYLSYCQKHYRLVVHPPPIHRGWENINGKCRPVRYKIPAIDTIFQSVAINSDEESEGDSEYGESSDDCDSGSDE